MDDFYRKRMFEAALALGVAVVTAGLGWLSSDPAARATFGSWKGRAVRAWHAWGEGEQAGERWARWFLQDQDRAVLADAERITREAVTDEPAG